MVSHRNVPFSCFCCPREMGCNMLPTAASKQDCPHGSCKAMGLRRDKFLSLTIANGLQADWQLQSTQFPALVLLTRHLWGCTLSWWRKEAEQVCSRLFLYCTSICFSPQLARPGAQFRSSQQKPLYEAWESPSTINTTWTGLPRHGLFWAPQVVSPSHWAQGWRQQMPHHNTALPFHQG